MEYTVSNDGVATHLDCQHDSVTAKMIDWFWSNMEKGFILLHPEQHEPLEWIVAGPGLEEACLANPEPMGYRNHQWQKSDAGVVGRSTAYGTRKRETEADGKVWAAHCVQEVGSWGEFLPQLYTLYRVLTDTRRNPCADLSVDGTGRNARYRHIAQSMTVAA